MLESQCDGTEVLILVLVLFKIIFLTGLLSVFLCCVDASCLLNAGIVHFTCSGYQKEVSLLFLISSLRVLL